MGLHQRRTGHARHARSKHARGALLVLVDLDMNDKRECEKVANTVFPDSILQRLYGPVSTLARTGSTKSNSCRF